MRPTSLGDGVFILIVLFLVAANYVGFNQLLSTAFAGSGSTIEILQGRASFGA